MSRSAGDAARELKQLLIGISPLIEGYTSRICPGCAEVCCRQRHGAFTAVDRAYISALGEQAPFPDPSRDPDGPCQFLEEQGCAKPRWQRAWRCTWFFCDPLLEALDQGPQRDARGLTAAIERIMRLYEQLEEERHEEGAERGCTGL